MEENAEEASTEGTDEVALSKSIGEKEVNDSDETSSDSEDELEIMCSACAKKFSGYIPYKQHVKSKTHERTLMRKKLENKLNDDASKVESTSGQTVQDFLFYIKKPFAVCQPCCKQFSGPEAFHQHLASKTHKRKLLEDKILKNVKENGKVNVESLMKLFEVGGAQKASEETGEDVTDFYENKFLEDIKEKLSIADEDMIRSYDTTDSPSGDNAFECKECEKVFTGIVPYAQHLMSKTHDKRLKQLKLMAEIKAEGYHQDEFQHSDSRDISNITVEDDVLSCKLCMMCFSGPESAFAHLKSRGHNKKIQLRKFMKEQKERFKSSKRTESSTSKMQFCDEEKEACSADESKLGNASGDDVGCKISDEANAASVSEAYSKYKIYKSIMKEIKPDVED